MPREQPLRTGVIQPLPGIGDMMWLLPALKSIAASTEEGKIILYTKMSSQAAKLFAAEPFISSIVALPYGRGLVSIFINFIATWWALRRTRPERLYIFHQSARYRLAAKLAGIKEIIPYTKELARSKKNGWIKSLQFLEQLRIPITNRHSSLTIDPANIQKARDKFKSYPEPWFVVSPGASETDRCWPPERFAVCADMISDMLGGTVFLTGTNNEEERIKSVYNLSKRRDKIIPAVGLPFDVFMGLLAASQGLFGNDSGPANVAAALGRKALVLCGTSLPALHSPRLLLIVPDQETGDKKSMENISLDQAVTFIRAAL